MHACMLEWHNISTGGSCWSMAARAGRVDTWGRSPGPLLSHGKQWLYVEGVRAAHVRRTAPPSAPAHHRLRIERPAGSADGPRPTPLAGACSAYVGDLVRAACSHPLSCAARRRVYNASRGTDQEIDPACTARRVCRGTEGGVGDGAGKKTIESQRNTMEGRKRRRAVRHQIKDVR